MAITATSTVVNDGYHNHVVHLTGISDGSGQETNVTKVDVSSLMPPCAAVKIMKIQYTVSYGVVKLTWDALTPEDFLILDGQGEFDYCRIGGLVNTVGDSATGDLLLSTLGFELNSTYSILLELVKKDPVQ